MLKKLFLKTTLILNINTETKNQKCTEEIDFLKSRRVIIYFSELLKFDNSCNSKPGTS